MKIESDVARAARLGDDAIDAFNMAVNNGQARLGMSILVDIINAFAEKLDELTESQDEKDTVAPQKTEEPKTKNTATKEEVKPKDDTTSKP